MGVAKMYLLAIYVNESKNVSADSCILSILAFGSFSYRTNAKDLKALM